MNELHLQDKFLLPFFRDMLGYQEVRANTVSNSLIIEEDLERFISDTEMNKKSYETLLRKYGGDGKKLLADMIALIQERAASSRNMALFINSNKSVTLNGEKLFLFYPSDSVIHDNALFDQNIFSVVQELPYKYIYEDRQIFSFRPDLCFFVNGIYLGYSELKSNYMSQNASRNGRGKVIKDYFDAVRVYHQVFDHDLNLSEREKESYRRDFLKIFEKAIHITTTDIGETYVIRNISDFFDEILATCRAEKFDRESYEKEVVKVFKPYPLLNGDVEKKDKLKEIFTFHYGREFIEKEILYYNFIERDVRVKGDTKELKNEPGALISPRPKQKFGTDKIMSKIDEFLAHEGEDDYFEKLLEKQLTGVGETRKKELLEKRRAYSNNKNIYSLLLQYAAGFGKSNIIGWTALQLKDLRRPYNGKYEYIYDKIFIIVDRIQLRGQIDTKMRNMNIDKSLFMEARNKNTFLEALDSDLRLVIVNLQKFGSLKEILDAEVLQRLTQKRVVFLIDEIHRSHSGEQSEEMVSIFDELQLPFDKDTAYQKTRKKKNLIAGFTATPDDNALARFGEFGKFAENEKLWVPFDAYTMREAIEDGYILNPIENIVPIASKMLFDKPNNKLKGFVEKEYKDADKKQIYENRARIDAIAAYVADLLVKDVYRQIRGEGKAMLAVYSIKAAIAYKDAVTRHFKKLVKEPKYQKYADRPIYVIYSDNQDEQKAAGINDGQSEEKVLQEFAKKKNGLMIVVAKLQTGYDEKRLHTLFLDKEVREIGAIQAISRVNRYTKNKNDCKVVDFSYNNVNVQNIKDAFEHFSDVVVSDFDPFGDKRILEEVLYGDLKKSDVYEKFFERFGDIFKDKTKRDNPESYLAFEGSLEKHINANPKRTADIKAKSAQYFSILNRIEYVIEIDKKYSEPSFLYFWRKFNALYNTLNRSEDTKDPIEVYFDNQIGIIEVKTEPTPEKKKKETKVAQAPGEYSTGYKFDILKVIEARNAQEAIVGTLIQEFADKIEDLFEYVRTSQEGRRLIIKIKSNVSEDEIYDDFAKIYRRYRALNRQRVGDYFFKETEDLVNKLCDDFEVTVRV
ncbi:MAG: DEAD/DEAH box helicase family protein [Anaerolineales bacterium]